MTSYQKALDANQSTEFKAIREQFKLIPYIEMADFKTLDWVVYESSLEEVKKALDRAGLRYQISTPRNGHSRLAINGFWRVINNTQAVLSDVLDLSLVGIIRNNWRRRNVKLFLPDNQSADSPSMLYMAGYGFDSEQLILSLEAVGMNESIAMDYWKNGKKIYVRD